MPLTRAQVAVRGIVQGVGFRWSTCRRANQLGLTGWVRNCTNGTVEAVFEGEEDSVGAMVDWCRQGPSSAVVDDVSVAWQQATGEFRRFDATG